MPTTKKTVIDSLGYAIELELHDGRMLISTSGVRPGIMLERLDVEIFKAFLDRAINLPIDQHRDEMLSNDIHLVLEPKSPPYIGLLGKAGQINIHPASWLPLSCELALCVPRLAKQAA